jgi:peptidoglycan/LPS O-acetylase OafA/YrhL
MILVTIRAAPQSQQGRIVADILFSIPVASDGKRDQLAQTQGRFTVLDSWRGVCAIIVVVYHFTAESHLLFLPFFRNGWIFVDFFFVLSGFVITHAYQHHLDSANELLAFAIRRFGRIWPLHVAILVLFLITEALKLLLTAKGFSADHAPFAGEMSIPGLVANIFLVQSMGVLTYVSWNVPSWSISVEYWTYIVFGVAVLATSKAQRPRFWNALLLTGIFLFSLIVLIVYAKALETIVTFGFFRCLLGFIGGHFAYQLWRRLPVLRGSTTVELTTVLLVTLFAIYLANGLLAFLAPIVFGGAVIVFAHERGALSRLLRGRFFVMLGTLSYSIYMTHWFLHDAFRKVLNVAEQKTGITFSVPMQLMVARRLVTAKIVVWGGPFFSDLLLVLFLAVVIGVSVLTFRFIEKPGQRIFGRLARRVLPPSERSTLVSDPKPL